MLKQVEISYKQYITSLLIGLHSLSSALTLELPITKKEARADGLGFGEAPKRITILKVCMACGRKKYSFYVNATILTQEALQIILHITITHELVIL